MSEQDETNTGAAGSVNGSGVDGDGSGSSNGANATPWTAGMDEGQAAFVSNKGWSNAADVVNGYRELESLRGVPADRLLKLPDPASATADDYNHVYTALGRPENADGYDIKLPDGAPEVLQPRVDAFKQKAFELGLNPEQANALAAWDSQFMGTFSEEATANRNVQNQNDIVELRRDWGAGFDRKMRTVDAAQVAFGLHSDEISAIDNVLGRKRTLSLLADIGSRLGEDSLDDERGGGGVKKFGAMTPAEAEVEIGRLKMDDAFMQKYRSGNPDAAARMDDLFRLKHGG